MNNDKNNAAKLADLIDSLMMQGSGHINVSSSEENGEINIDTFKSNDCSGNKGACCQPTEFSDEDDEQL
ncbi:MAG: hypothetical protein IKL31_01670 [Ruminococcus sp.]|nr:hypothetical protein [Ruminococcus sp.]MBO5383205.1 hypothetical protein [Ruminococcus sp.]MBR6669438.1 hypothetical protein [Ruminococcus sp.]